MSDWTCRCGATNGENEAYCERCGGEAPKDRTPAAPQPRACHCEAPLLASGRCSATGGFPSTANPHSVLPACPHCRGPLEWSGACFRCHGSPTGRREDWGFPGEEYQLDKGHWQVSAPAGRRACSPEDNAEAVKAYRAVLARIGHLPSTRT